MYNKSKQSIKSDRTEFDVVKPPKKLKNPNDFVILDIGYLPGSSWIYHTGDASIRYESIYAWVT
jgi:hypothetical protein